MSELHDLTTTRPIKRYSNGSFHSDEDPIVTEQPITIELNGDEFATLVCSPEYIEDLAIGFLASEGVIRRYSDLTHLAYDEQKGFIYAEVDQLNPYFAASHSKRYITSCCGKSRQGFYFWSDARTANVIATQTAKLTADDCFRLMEALQAGSNTFRETGGVHNAALVDRSGNLIETRTDIGRHNALDKLYGHALRHNLSMEGVIVLLSGRLSSEMLLKVAKIGCEIVLTKSAPTALALDLADQLGITAVGFIRGRSLNVYTHPERIVDAGGHPL